LELLKESDGLTDLHVKTTIVVEVALDLINGEINEHASNLGGKSLTNEFLNIGVDELTNHLLEVGVLREDCGNVAETLLIVGVNLGVRVSEVSGTGGGDNLNLGSRLLLINDGNWLRRHGVVGDGSLRWDSGLAGGTTWDTVVSGLAGSVVVVLTTGGSHGILRAGHVSLDQG